MIGFIVVFYISRVLGEKAMKLLNTEQKAGLIDLFTTERKYGSAAIVCLIIAFLVVLQFRLVAPIITFSSYFIIMTVYIAFKNYRTYKKLTEHNYPKRYIQKMMVANLISMIGILVCMFLMFFESFFR
jgi:4-hydroxybenzoate polyprenyltransferase